MIPVAAPVLDGKEIEYVLDCLKTNWISSGGKYVKEFEEKFAKFVNAKHGISTTSGTTALHLALAALGIGKGDEVIIPDFTMIACAFAVVYTGAKPVFVDAEPRTWNIDVTKIEEKITSRTKAIMAVHLFGHPCDMDPILEIAEKHGLFVIEDAAEAHGAEYKGKVVGCLGDVGCFSFYANKIITTGEGGMVVTNDDDIAEKSRFLRNLAFDKERTYIHKEIGFNYRMTNIQAAIGLAQLENIQKHIEIKRKIAKAYNKLLLEIGGIRTPVEEPWAKNVYWMYAILLEDSFGKGRDEVRRKLAEMGIDTRLLFAPMHSQPSLRFLNNTGSYPVSEDLYARGLYLPSGIGLTREEIERVVEALRKIKRL